MIGLWHPGTDPVACDFRHVFVALGEPWWLPAGPLMLTVEPRCGMTTVLDGRWDQWLADLARAVSGRCRWVRFAHEQNGTWYDWSTAKVPHDQWAASWRHVMAALPGQKAWGPNVDFPGALPFWDAYPGDAAVDLVGFSGYDFSGTTGPDALFGPSLALVAGRKPVLVAETATWTRQKSWARQLRRWAAQHQVDPVCWFDEDKTGSNERAWALRPGARQALLRG